MNTRYFQTRSAKDQFQVLRNNALGGNVTTILARQFIRTRGMGAALDRARLLEQLGNRAPEYAPPSVYVAGVPVTTRTQEAYTLSSDATEHPVESGAILSDHVILRPIMMELSFEVTNWEPGKAKLAQDLLELMWRERVPLELQTEHKKIPDMVLTNLQSDNSVPHWGKLAFRATFQQIKLISLETAAFPADQVAQTEKTGGPDNAKSIEAPANQGLQQPREVSGAALAYRRFFGE